MADYLQFSEIYAAVERAVKDLQASHETMIKEMINMVYMNEIMLADSLYPFFWLVDFDESLLSVAESDISTISQAADGVIETDAAHGLSTADIVALHNIAGMTELNDQLFAVSTVPTTTTFTVGVNTTTYTAYSSGGNVVNRGKTLAVSGKNVQRILAASWNYEGPMEEIHIEGIENDIYFHNYEQVTRPKKYYHAKDYSTTGTETNQILWYPGADAAYRLRYWFVERVAKLVNDTDVPVLPPQFHYALVAGCCARLAEYGGVQVENAIIWPQIYASQLAALEKFNNQYWKEHENQTWKTPYLL